MAEFGSLAPEVPDEYGDNFARNQPYVRPGPNNYTTQLGGQEPAFRQWVNQNAIPFNPDAPVSDYDMRGFYRALTNNDPRAQSAVDPNDSRMHYPDYWKTPYHETFSNQSQWAKPNAPAWTGDDKLVAPSGRILFDDRNRNQIISALLRSAQQPGP